MDGDNVRCVCIGLLLLLFFSLAFFSLAFLFVSTYEKVEFNRPDERK